MVEKRQNRKQGQGRLIYFFQNHTSNIVPSSEPVKKHLILSGARCQILTHHGLLMSRSKTREKRRLFRNIVPVPISDIDLQFRGHFVMTDQKNNLSFVAKTKMHANNSVGCMTNIGFGVRLAEIMPFREILVVAVIRGGGGDYKQNAHIASGLVGELMETHAKAPEFTTTNFPPAITQISRS